MNTNTKIQMGLACVVAVIISLGSYYYGKRQGILESRAAASISSIENTRPWYKPWASDEYAVRFADGTTSTLTTK